MKRIINTILVIVAVLTILGVTAVVRAGQDTQTATETAQKTVEYFLPYPGILPGHPLYPLKMIRDKIVSLFIIDPIKKAEYFLLMADKRVNAGKFLIDYNKISLGEPTISKGQNYLDQTLGLVEETKKQGKNVEDLISRLEKATQKHEEVLEELLLKVPEAAKPGIRNAIERSKKAQEKVREIVGAKKTK